MKAALTLVRIAKQEEVGAGRQGNIHAATGLHCAVDDAEANTLLWRSPSAEGNTPPTPEHAECFMEESIWLWEVRDPEVADHSIEAGLWEGQRASVTFPEIDVRVVLASKLKLRG